ncbi:hypothetical protein AJ79_02655 [Helicocarpus griseus UAMH5409]|uniref:F-box domain-containing protein n=1 Tax=Helicocarpus griseus UAMH5409 TaxID=1447875 RepID=A0A2B7Y1W8_9EURO|nr:hypothetical protein AJ79_02655 [Helicocarpus griseus UAMH5409]
MDKFPQEIISAILGHFDEKEDRSQIISFATISRQWQFAVERFNLRCVKVESTALSTFANLFRPSQSHRNVLVKVIHFGAVLPSYSDEACCEYETEIEKDTNSQVFSEAIHELFKVLREIKNSGGFHLDVDAWSPMDSHRRPDAERKRYFGDPNDLWEKRYQTSFLQLRDHERLPVLSNISSFSCRASRHGRYIEPASAMAMVAKMTDLEKATLVFYDEDDLSVETRQMNRYNLAKAMSACAHSVDEIIIQFLARGPEWTGKRPPNLLPPGSTVDSLNPALHKYIQRANITKKVLLMGHFVTPELFWPSPDTTSMSLPLWQNLQEMHVLMPTSAPDGGYYLVPDHSTSSDSESSEDSENSDEEDEDEDEDTDEDEESYDYGDSSSESAEEVEYVPNPERMNPLLIAMARAAQHAPSLEKMRLRVPRPYGGRYFDVWFLVKGVPSKSEEEEPSDKTRVIWQVGDWRPDEEVLRHWRNAIPSDGVMLYNVSSYY